MKGYAVFEIKLQNLENPQATLNQRANEISSRIQGMQDATLFNAINADITLFDREINELQEAAEAQRQREEEARREEERRAAEDARNSADKIRERLNARLDTILDADLSDQSEKDNKTDIKNRIDSSENTLTLSDECKITKEILQLHLAITRRKITFKDNDPCKDKLITDADSVVRLINSLQCNAADTIETAYNNVSSKIQELREAVGDKIRTFIVMRGGGGASNTSASGIT